MQSQHERVDAFLQESAAAAARWANAADTDRDRLADVFDELSDTLVEHLDAEEQRLLPIAARSLTRRSGTRWARRARTGTHPSKQLLTSGCTRRRRRRRSSRRCWPRLPHP